MHALGSWCERYRSGTGARQSDRSSLWIKTRSALRLYFARSAPRSLHAPLRSHALEQTGSDILGTDFYIDDQSISVAFIYGIRLVVLVWESSECKVFNLSHTHTHTHTHTRTHTYAHERWNGSQPGQRRVTHPY